MECLSAVPDSRWEKEHGSDVAASSVLPPGSQRSHQMGPSVSSDLGSMLVPGPQNPVVVSDWSRACCSRSAKLDGGLDEEALSDTVYCMVT